LTRNLIVLGSILAMTACTSDPEDTGTETDTEVFDSAFGGGNNEDLGIQPQFLSYRLLGALDSKGTLRAFNNDGDEIAPQIILLFWTQDYPNATSIEQQQEESCTVAIDVDEAQREPMARKDHFPNEDDADFHQAWQFTLEFDEVEDTSCDTDVDPTAFGEGATDLISKWNGATLGYGIAPNGSNEEMFDARDENTDDMTQHYIAFVDEDGDFEAQAVTYGFNYEYDQKSGDLLTEGTDDEPIPVDVTTFPATEPITNTVMGTRPWIGLNILQFPKDLSKK